jgi:hypothetical protein
MPKMEQSNERWGLAESKLNDGDCYQDWIYYKEKWESFYPFIDSNGCSKENLILIYI